MPRRAAGRLPISLRFAASGVTAALALPVQMTIEPRDLAAFGWSDHYQSQVTPDELGSLVPARVLAVHRNRLRVANPLFEESVPPFSADAGEEGSATVGDWLLLDGVTRLPRRLLRRRSLFRRKAAGNVQRVQLIAANIDTLFIVSSCNDEFNVARLERYLALARQAGVTPVVVLTKADLTGDAADYTSRVLKLLPGLVVECLDARDPESASVLRPWCGAGQTVALVGSSGVGKSTLVNTLLREAVQATGGIRENDSHGRHTTSGRSLHRLQAGGWLLDTPGIRELQLADSEAGVEDVFVDIVALAAIAARITEFGFTPNRVAALGENLILLVNLTWSAWLYWRFVRGGGPFAALEGWQTAYLPVYSAWAAVVVIIFPPLFRYL